MPNRDGRHRAYSGDHPSAGPSTQRMTLIVMKDSTVASIKAAAMNPSWPYFCARIG